MVLFYLTVVRIPKFGINDTDAVLSAIGFDGAMLLFDGRDRNSLFLSLVFVDIEDGVGDVLELFLASCAHFGIELRLSGED